MLEDMGAKRKLRWVEKMLMGVGSCNSDLLNEPCAFLSDEVARSRPLSNGRYLFSNCVLDYNSHLMSLLINT